MDLSLHDVFVVDDGAIGRTRQIGSTPYPKLPTKRSVDGTLYARFASGAERLRQGLGLGLGLADFSELDALFNYAYQWGYEKGDVDDEE